MPHERVATARVEAATGAGGDDVMDALEHYARALKMVYASAADARECYCPTCGETSWDPVEAECVNPDCAENAPDGEDGGEA